MIALDLDGTLEDSRRDMTSVVHRVRARFGLPEREDAAILPWVNKGMDALYRSCFDDFIQGRDERLDAVRAAYEADYLANVAAETKLYPGIAGALERLDGIGALSIVTNKPEKISRRLIEVLGIDRLIRAVVGGDTCLKSKPDPMVLSEAARRCRFDPTKGCAVMIGDTAADIKMGRAFGASTIWCAWGYAADPGEKPDFKAGRPEELPELVKAALKLG